MPIKITVISTDWAVNEYRTKHNLYGGIGYYRLYRPYEELARQSDVEVTFYNRELQDLKDKNKDWEFLAKIIRDSDIVVTKAIDNGPAASMVAFYCDYFKTKLVLDLDDNYFEVTEDQPAYKYYHKGSEKRAILSAYLSLVDVVICSTEPLQRYYRDRIKKVFNKETPVYLMPNFNKVEDWNFKPAPKEKKKLVIGWAGSTTHDADLQLVMPALNQLLNEYSDLHLELCGGVTVETAPKIMRYVDKYQKVAIKGGTQAWEGYPEMMMNKKWDIGIAPLVNNEFTRGKSHIKWMEYAMMKMPCVASKVYPYYKDIDGLKTITDGETGYLAIDALEFYKKLKLLIDNQELRTQIGLNAYNHVKDNWQWENNIWRLKNIITNL